jgi:hypothetical protein
MINAIKELEVFIRKETQIGSVSSITYNPGPGVNIFIDHENPELNTEGNFIVYNLPITATISDVKKNWEQVIKNCQIITKELKVSKKHIWRVNEIERVENESDYILRIRLSARVPIV